MVDACEKLGAADVNSISSLLLFNLYLFATVTHRLVAGYSSDVIMQT